MPVAVMNDSFAFSFSDGRHLFHRLFFYGHEKKMLIFEILLFGVVNLSIKNYVMSGLVVYFVSSVGKLLPCVLSIAIPL